MDIKKAKEIVSALAEGFDPTTGELLSEDNVCNKGEVVRAFYTILQTLDSKSKRSMPANSGKPWTQEDEKLLVNLYHSGVSKKDICNTFKRTATGIAARLVRLGVIENRYTFRDRK